MWATDLSYIFSLLFDLSAKHTRIKGRVLGVFPPLFFLLPLFFSFSSGRFTWHFFFRLVPKRGGVYTASYNSWRAEGWLPLSTVLGKLKYVSWDMCLLQVHHGLSARSFYLRFFSPPLFASLNRPSVCHLNGWCKLVRLWGTFLNLIRSRYILGK